MGTRPTAVTRRWAQPIELITAARPKYPKYHVDVSCSGLDRQRFLHPADAGEWGTSAYTGAVSYATTTRVTSFDSWLDMLEDANGRPCRRCTFELSFELLMQAVTAEEVADDPVPVMFSGQPTPTEFKKMSSYKWREVSESGAQRVLRLRDRYGFDGGHACVGNFAVATLPRQAADVLGRNLRTVELPGPGFAPSELEVVWALLSAEQGRWELERRFGSDQATTLLMDDTDPFELARAVMS